MSDDEFSLSGLTQTSPKVDNYDSEATESDEDTNYNLLLSHAKELEKSSQNKMRDFEDFVFEIGMDSQDSPPNLHIEENYEIGTSSKSTS